MIFFTRTNYSLNKIEKHQCTIQCLQKTPEGLVLALTREACFLSPILGRSGEGLATALLSQLIHHVIPYNEPSCQPLPSPLPLPILTSYRNAAITWVFHTRKFAFKLINGFQRK